MNNSRLSRFRHLDRMLLSAPDLTEIMSLILAGGNRMRMRTRGGSMSPFIRHDDIVTIAPVSGKRIKPGHVVAFTNRDNGNHVRLSMHRVIQRLDHGNYLIKGDNTANDPDGVVPDNRILGRVVKVERKDRFIRLGMGPERRLVARLSRHGLLIPLVAAIRRIRGSLTGRRPE